MPDSVMLPTDCDGVTPLALFGMKRLVLVILEREATLSRHKYMLRQRVS